MKKLEDYVNFELHNIPDICNYIAVDFDGTVWAFTNKPEFNPTDEVYECRTGLNHLVGKLLTESQVIELEECVAEIPKPRPAGLNKLSNLHSLSHGEMTTLHTILTTLPSYYNEYVFTILQGLDSTITSLTIELKDERVARSKLSKELKLIAQELE